MNSDTIKPHLSKYKKNQQVTIVSTGDDSDKIWLAPLGKISSNQFITGSNNMSEVEWEDGNLQIFSPRDEGNYYLYVIDQYNNVSPSSWFHYCR